MVVHVEKKQTGSKDYRQLVTLIDCHKMDIRTIVIPTPGKENNLKKISEISFANSYSCILNFHKIYFKLRKLFQCFLFIGEVEDSTVV